MSFEKFKQQFDSSFSKVDPKEFVKKMEQLGYRFENICPYEELFDLFRSKGFSVEVYSANNENVDWYFLIKKGTITTNDIVYKSREEANSECLKVLIKEILIDFKPLWKN